MTLEPTTCITSFASEWFALGIGRGRGLDGRSWLADIVGWL
jgi:hypothetical protein